MQYFRYLVFTIGLFCTLQSTIAQSPRPRFYNPQFSDSNLLGINNNLLEKSNSGFTINTNTIGSPDTLKLLVIRVDFQTDNNTLTTGNGKFQFAIDTEKTIDVPPHNRPYFEAQLLALSNYYKKVSRGNLILEADVFPAADTAGYTVFNQMSYYSPAGNDELLDTRLAEFFQESFQIADLADNIDFSNYDSFIIFHAGVGSDFALDFDSTPQDIPSVFLNFNELKNELGNSEPNYAGIAVNNGSFHIRDGIILPETQSQDQFEIGMLGTMALMFGNQLGLPILFNPDNGRSGIGVFGLMDQGSGNFFGMVPAEPCAWSKIFLGWETPIVVKNGDALPVATSLAKNVSQIYKIPINAKEYFLIENRSRDFNGDNFAIGFDAKGTKVEFVWDDRGQILQAQEQIGVITSVSEYDFGLPGSGILIWHIDENIIGANFAQNRVNADPGHRGVDLEEADGAQDLGQFYGFLSAGFGAENGVIEDMFWGSNEINLLVNRNSDAVVFSPETLPNSSANNGSNSYIRIFDFSEPDSIMSFSVENTILRPGFPQITAEPGTSINAPVAADLNNDGVSEIISTSSNSTEIYVWNADGTKFIPNDEMFNVIGLNGVTESYEKALFATPPGEKIFSPAIATSESDTIVVVTTDRSVAFYQPEDADSNGRADEIYVYESQVEITTAPLVYSNTGSIFEVVFGNADGGVILIDSDSVVTPLIVAQGGGAISGIARNINFDLAYTTISGEVGLIGQNRSLIWQRQTNSNISNSPVIADLNRDGNVDFILVSDSGELFAFTQNGDNLEGLPTSSGVENPSAIAVSDIDGDGFLDVVFTGDNQLFAFNHIGSLKNNFPVQISRAEEVGLGAPVLVDLTSDGIPEIVTGTSDNRVIAYSGSGMIVDGFPVSPGGKVNSAPYIADLEDDGDVEIVAIAEDGFIYVWDFASSYNADASPWPGLFGGLGHLNFNDEFNQPQQPSTNSVMAKNLVYNYPNPTEGNQTTIRYRLNEAADVNIKIYDLAGDFVDELTGPGFPQADNEVTWSLTNIQSGVYLARVEAKGASNSDVKVIKIAVVK